MGQLLQVSYTGNIWIKGILVGGDLAKTRPLPRASILLGGKPKAADTGDGILNPQEGHLCIL